MVAKPRDGMQLENDFEPKNEHYNYVMNAQTYMYVRRIRQVDVKRWSLQVWARFAMAPFRPTLMPVYGYVAACVFAYA